MGFSRGFCRLSPVHDLRRTGYLHTNCRSVASPGCRASQLFAEEQALLPEANRIAGMLAEEYKLKFFVSNLVYQEKRFVELIFPDRDAARHGLKKGGGTG